MRMVVVFPAPFGPRKPRTSPRSTRNETESTAVARPYLLVRLSTSIIGLTSPGFVTLRRVDGGAGRCPRPLSSEPSRSRAPATQASDEAREGQYDIDAIF